MPSNSQGSYRTTREAMMNAFDKLPEAIRSVLHDSLANWVPQPVLTTYRKGCRKLPEHECEKLCIEMIERWNREERDEHWYRMNRMQEHGIDYHTPIRRRKK